MDFDYGVGSWKVKGVRNSRKKKRRIRSNVTQREGTLGFTGLVMSPDFGFEKGQTGNGERSTSG